MAYTGPDQFVVHPVDTPVASHKNRAIGVGATRSGASPGNADDGRSRLEPVPAGSPADGFSGGLVDALGSTPLVQFRRLLDVPVEVWGKLEGLNPGGSSKARPAARMIADALERGLIKPGSTVVESSSGNMGVGLAGACALADLRFVCVIDDGINPNTESAMRALGAECRRVGAGLAEGRSMLEARLELVRQIVAETPGAYWPNQYDNPSNPASHADGTIREIDEALEGDFDYLFVAAGTAGTLRGCLEYLAAHPRGCRVVAVDAVGSVLFGGVAGVRKLPGMGAGIESVHSRISIPDRVERVSDLDCVTGCRRMARQEGLLVGASSGGVMTAIERLAPSLPRGSRCVGILPDLGTGYLETVFDDDWVARELGESALANVGHRPADVA